MKMAKKLVAVLLAGVLALSVLTACSGSAGPLTKDNVTDYIIDYYKATKQKRNSPWSRQHRLYWLM